MNYLPLTILAIYYVMALIIKLINKKDVAKLLSIGTFAVCSALSIAMLMQTLDGQPLQLRLFELARPMNLVVKVEIIEALIVTLFSVVGFMIMWSSTTMISDEVEDRKYPLYYALSTALVGSICGVMIFENLINIYVFMEIATFIATAVIMIKDTKENHKAGISYITLSIMGSAFILMGIVIIYTMTGSYTMSEIHAALPTVFAQQPWSLFYAMVFITIGGAFKSALFPFHIWSPNAYTYAPAPTSAMLSGLVSKPYIIFYLNVCYKMIGMDLLHTYPMNYILLGIMLMGAGGMIYGSLWAIVQEDIKRMIAYSSVAQIGYIFMGIGLGSPLGLVAAVYHIVTHIITKAMLFLVAGSTIQATGNRNIREMGGVGIEMPVTMALFTIGGLSMIGVPLFMGFVSKYNFALGILESNNFWVMFVLVISGLLNIIYYLPIALRGYFGKAAQEKIDSGKTMALERPLMHLLPIAVLGVATIAFGLFSSGLINLIVKGVSIF